MLYMWMCVCLCVYVYVCVCVYVSVCVHCVMLYIVLRGYGLAQEIPADTMLYKQKLQQK